MSVQTQTALSGLRKAAIVALVLGEDVTAKVFKHLTEDEIEQLAREMAGLGAVPSGQSEAVLDEFNQIAVAAQDAGITPLLRVPGFEHHLATRALDGGAQGIVFPHVDDAATAARLVSNCRFPPDGKRSMTGALPQLGFGTHPIGEMARAGVTGLGGAKTELSKPANGSQAREVCVGDGGSGTVPEQLDQGVAARDGQ